MSGSPISNAVRGRTTHHGLTVDGLVRDYALHVPCRCDAGTMPLVLVMHGWDAGYESADSYMQSWEVLAEEHCFVVAFPEGYATQLGTSSVK